MSTTTKPCVLQGVTRQPILNVPTYRWTWSVDDINIFNMDIEFPERCLMATLGGPVVVHPGIIGRLDVLGPYGNGMEFELKNFAVPTLLYD